LHRKRRPPQHLRLWGSDRALMVWMTRLWPNLLVLARVVQPTTILRWHRAGFRTYWRWRSQGRSGRPTIAPELRDLMRRIALIVHWTRTTGGTSLLSLHSRLYGREH